MLFIPRFFHQMISQIGGIFKKFQNHRTWMSQLRWTVLNIIPQQLINLIPTLIQSSASALLAFVEEIEETIRRGLRSLYTQFFKMINTSKWKEIQKQIKLSQKNLMKKVKEIRNAFFTRSEFVQQIQQIFSIGKKMTYQYKKVISQHSAAIFNMIVASLVYSYKGESMTMALIAEPMKWVMGYYLSLYVSLVVVFLLLTSHFISSNQIPSFFVNLSGLCIEMISHILLLSRLAHVLGATQFALNICLVAAITYSGYRIYRAIVEMSAPVSELEDIALTWEDIATILGNDIQDQQLLVLLISVIAPQFAVYALITSIALPIFYRTLTLWNLTTITKTLTTSCEKSIPGPRDDATIAEKLKAYSLPARVVKQEAISLNFDLWLKESYEIARVKEELVNNHFSTTERIFIDVSRYPIFARLYKAPYMLAASIFACLDSFIIQHESFTVRKVPVIMPHDISHSVKDVIQPTPSFETFEIDGPGPSPTLPSTPKQVRGNP